MFSINNQQTNHLSSSQSSTLSLVTSLTHTHTHTLIIKQIENMCQQHLATMMTTNQTNNSAKRNIIKFKNQHNLLYIRNFQISWLHTSMANKRDLSKQQQPWLKSVNKYTHSLIMWPLMTS